MRLFSIVRLNARRGLDRRGPAQLVVVGGTQSWNGRHGGASKLGHQPLACADIRLLRDREEDRLLRLRVMCLRVGPHSDGWDRCDAVRTCELCRLARVMQAALDMDGG